jgi:hypothetical protein
VNATETIARLLSEPVRSSGLFSESLLVVPASGATQAQLHDVTVQLGRPLSAQHARLLSSWNGLDLDVIRLFGAAPAPNGILPLSKTSIAHAPSGWLAFGSDPAGYVYFEDPSGAIHSFDHDGGHWTRVAPNLDAFITELVFGPKAALFAGEEWLATLRQCGVVDAV